MSLQAINNSGINIPLSLKTWAVEKGKVTGLLYDSVNDNSFAINYPLTLIQDIEDYSNYQIFLLKNKFGTKDDHYFILNIDGKRKGIFFPIKIFSDPSNLPLPADDKFLYRFLHIAFYHLLSGTVASNVIDYTLLTEDPELKIEYFYDEETVVLLYFDELNPLEKFDIKKFYPSLLKFGYVPILSTSDFAEIEMLNVISSKSPLYSYTPLSNINLIAVRSNIIDEQYISQVFETLTKYKLTPLLRFIILYQVIELLINKIAVEYYNKNNPFSAQLSAMMINTQSAPTFRDILEKITHIQSEIAKSVNIRKEESRINILFGEKCKFDIGNYLELQAAAKMILGILDCKTLTDYIYQLRNRITHNYHNLSITYPNLNELLFDFNLEFEKFIADIIINYEQ